MEKKTIQIDRSNT